MFIFVVWTIIAYINYGSDMSNYHLNLYATFTKINLYFDDTNLSGFTLIDTIRNFRKTLKDVTNSSITGRLINIFTNNSLVNTSTGFLVVINAVEMLINPVFAIGQFAVITCYLLVGSIQIVYYVVNFLMGIYEFIFNPVFIHI